MEQRQSESSTAETKVPEVQHFSDDKDAAVLLMKSSPENQPDRLSSSGSVTHKPGRTLEARSVIKIWMTTTAAV